MVPHAFGSVQPDYVVCLERGYHAQVLRRHLRVAHEIDVGTYRSRWKLPADHPITEPAYSERRSTMAKHLGLGRKSAAVVSTAEVVASTATGRSTTAAEQR
jgi:predicted transcriptional regulator